MLSSKREAMLAGQRYYEGKNDILAQGTRRAIPEETGSAREMADNRLAHTFLRELTDQKLQYLLGRPVTVLCPDSRSEEQMRQLMETGFTPLLKQTAKEAINKGRGHIYVYIDEAGKFRLKAMQSQQLIPVWQDEEHRQLKKMMRIYQKRNGEKKQEILECWDEKGYVEYQRGQEGIFPLRQGPHLKLKNGQGLNWRRLPFLTLKYNEEELPLLNSIKTLIDDYDRIASLDSNAIQDQPNSILVIRNYDGQDLGEFRRNLAAYRAVKVTDEGGVEALNTPLATEAANAHLDRLREDIYAFGRGVDVRRIRSMGSISGIALRHQYACLDLDCNGIENGLQQMLKELLWFYNAYLEACGQEGLPVEQIRFIFDRDIIINEEAAIDMCAASQGIISQKTILANHPWVQSAEEELHNLTKEQQSTEREGE